MKIMLICSAASAATATATAAAAAACYDSNHVVVQRVRDMNEAHADFEADSRATQRSRRRSCSWLPSTRLLLGQQDELDSCTVFLLQRSRYS